MVRAVRLSAESRAPAGIAGAAHLAQAAAVAERLFGFAGVEIALIVDQSFGLFLPDAHHPGGFFLQRHSRQQILDAARGR